MVEPPGSGATPDTWNDAGAYEAYVGRWSRRVAREFLHWLAIPAGSAWLDFGCGTGALSQTILAAGSPRLLVGCDRSPAYVEFARRHIPDRCAEFVVAEPPDLPRTAGGFDVIVSGLVLNFLPAPAEAVGAMVERACEGGTLAAYVWDYALGMQLMRAFWDSAGELDSGARALDEGTRFPLCHSDPLHDLFEQAGLHGVLVERIVVPTEFRDFDDYWTPFLGGQGPAPGYLASLPEDRRTRLREAIRQRLPTLPDGRIRLSAGAWAVKGIRGG